MPNRVFSEKLKTTQTSKTNCLKKKSCALRSGGRAPSLSMVVKIKKTKRTKSRDTQESVQESFLFPLFLFSSFFLLFLSSSHLLSLSPSPVLLLSLSPPLSPSLSLPLSLSLSLSPFLSLSLSFLSLSLYVAQGVGVSRSRLPASLCRAPFDGPGLQPTEVRGHTKCVARALVPTLAAKRPHVCHRQRDLAVSIGLHMQQDMDISKPPPHLVAPIPLFECFSRLRSTIQKIAIVSLRQCCNACFPPCQAHLAELLVGLRESAMDDCENGRLHDCFSRRSLGHAVGASVTSAEAWCTL